MNKDEIRAAVIKLYSVTPDTQWPREAFELALVLYGLNLEQHEAVIVDAKVSAEDREWWLEQVTDLQKMIDGDMKRFPWMQIG